MNQKLAHQLHQEFLRGKCILQLATEHNLSPLEVMEATHSHLNTSQKTAHLAQFYGLKPDAVVRPKQLAVTSQLPKARVSKSSTAGRKAMQKKLEELGALEQAVEPQNVSLPPNPALIDSSVLEQPFPPLPPVVPMLEAGRFCTRCKELVSIQDYGSHRARVCNRCRSLASNNKGQDSSVSAPQR